MEWVPLVGRTADYLPSGTVGQWLPAPCNGGMSKRAATLEPAIRRRGRLGPRAGIPKRRRPNLPLVCERRYSQISVQCVGAQWGGGPRTPVRQREGTRGPPGPSQTPVDLLGRLTQLATPAGSTQHVRFDVHGSPSQQCGLQGPSRVRLRPWAQFPDQPFSSPRYRRCLLVHAMSRRRVAHCARWKHRAKSNAESSDELQDGNITTVSAERFRCHELLFKRNPRHGFPVHHGVTG